MSHLAAVPIPRFRGARRCGLLGLVAILVFAGCAAPPPPRGGYRVGGNTYVPLKSAEGFSEVGLASWYGPGFHGRKTANGEVYDMYGRTAAHKLLPLGTVVRVTNLENGRSAEARINDRGPFVRGRVIDLSYALAQDLDIVDRGTARVKVVALQGPRGTPPPPAELAGPFAWQIGAFAVRENAYGLAAKLRDSFRVVSVRVYDRGDVVFHRVRVGQYTSTEEARRALPALQERGFSPFLVRAD